MEIHYSPYGLFTTLTPSEEPIPGKLYLWLRPMSEAIFDRPLTPTRMETGAKTEYIGELASQQPFLFLDMQMLGRRIFIKILTEEKVGWVHYSFMHEPEMNLESVDWRALGTFIST